MPDLWAGLPTCGEHVVQLTLYGHHWLIHCGDPGSQPLLASLASTGRPSNPCISCPQLSIQPLRLAPFEPWQGFWCLLNPPPQGPAYALSAHLPNLIPTVSPRGQALLVETLPWLSITVVDNVPVSESTTASWTWLAAMGCAAHLPFRREPVDRSFQLQCPQDLCLSLSHGHTLPGSNNQWLCPTGALGPDSFCPMQDSFDSQSLF